jgi:hypothetical protein
MPVGAWRSVERLHLKPHQRALLAAEVDTDEVDRQALGAVFVGVATGLDLRERGAFGGEPQIVFDAGRSLF